MRNLDAFLAGRKSSGTEKGNTLEKLNPKKTKTKTMAKTFREFCDLWDIVSDTGEHFQFSSCVFVIIARAGKTDHCVEEIVAPWKCYKWWWNGFISTRSRICKICAPPDIIKWIMTLFQRASAATHRVGRLYTLKFNYINSVNVSIEVQFYQYPYGGIIPIIIIIINQYHCCLVDHSNFHQLLSSLSFLSP